MLVTLALALAPSAVVAAGSVAREAVDSLAVPAASAAGAGTGAAEAKPRFAPALPLQREEAVDAAPRLNWWRGAVLAVVLAVFGAVLVLRRAWRAPANAAPAAQGAPSWASWLRQGAAPRSLRVVQSARLSPRASVHVLRWGDRELLVGCTEQGIRVLGTGRPTPEPASALDEVHAEAAATPASIGGGVA